MAWISIIHFRWVSLPKGPIRRHVPAERHRGVWEAIWSANWKDFEKDKITIVYDNEPRKPETVAKIEKAIKEGFSVVIWPNV